MIRLMLATYSAKERDELALALEAAQNAVELSQKCRAKAKPCSTCPMRHLCTDLLSASVYAKDFKPAPEKLPTV